ncbi:cell division control 14, SIN component [Trichodelitschia bisporula]|uniref:Cell division control 14, SIN component n=1 Tax=Trichodelitschia bisporula TaxID=703511 RepID=A0A6G1HL63_9PEZI|nr:cell division control 14, SIN component [Trichodelitschia bisporula]
MESLLTLAFDNLSSPTTTKIRKGLRQIEGLLAQICLSPTPQNAPAGHARRASVLPTPTPSSTQLTQHKPLSALPTDPAFAEFFRLQESFEWNVATRLTTTLTTLLSHPPTPALDSTLHSTLSLLQGTLLLHPPSRTLFAREPPMTALLDLLDPVASPDVQGAALLALVSALLGTPRAARTFEAADGLRTVAALFRRPGTERAVKVRVVEFLYFYLMEETPATEGAAVGAGGIGSAEGDGKKGEGSGKGSGKSEEGKSVHTRSTAEKQRLLARYMSNVEDLVQDLRESAFGGVEVGIADDEPR